MPGKSKYATASPEQRAIQAAQFYVRRVRFQLEELVTRTYPGGQPGITNVLALISGLLDTAEERVNSAQAATDQATVRTDIRDTLGYTRQAYLLMGMMRGADITEIDFAAVRPMQQWFTDLNIHMTIFFRAENLVNYELRSISEIEYRGIRSPSSTLRNAIKDITWPLTRVTVPSRALGILPHFAVVAHEVGHAIYHDSFKRQSRSVKRAPPLQNAISNSLDKNRVQLTALYKSFFINVNNRLSTPVPFRTLVPITFKIQQSWTEEIASDAIAFCLTGPASFFALSDILQFASGTFLFTDTHPPKILRRRFLFRLMCRQSSDFVGIISKYVDGPLKEDFNSALIPELPDSTDLFNEYRDQNIKPELAAILSELPPVIEVLGPIISDSVAQYFERHKNYKKYLYKTGDFRRDLNVHLGQLLNAVPPFESGRVLKSRRPTTLPTILNVGWMALLCKLEDFHVDTRSEPEHLIDGARAETLHRLLLKAVELSEIRRQWEYTK